jgi:capsular exopolysaccharide synthesis family protein
LAQAEKNTLIADCDFRSPAMHEMFGLDGGQGMVDALTGKHRLESLYHQPLPDLNLKVLTAGVRPSNPAELLSLPRVSEFFASVRGEFDYVLVDSPPTGLISDPLILATQADGVLLTLDARKTSKHDLQRTMRDLDVVGANVLGTVVNNAQASKNGYL